jgi:histidinol-phosphatase (PHP family)
MFLADYHTHSVNSPDGRDSVEALCEGAMDASMGELVVTDHFDAAQNQIFTSPFFYEKGRDECFAAAKKYTGHIKVLFGIELGQPHFDLPACQKLLDKKEFDFVIGSIHNLSGDRDVYFFDYHEIDHNKIFLEYVLELIEMAQKADFDVVGHLNYPARYMWAQAKRQVILEDYEEYFRELFKLLIASGRGIEVNTSGMRQSIGMMLPPLYLVRLFKECGGEIITVGSDAHARRDVGKHIAEGQELLRQAGFSYVSAFEKRQVRFEKI